MDMVDSDAGAGCRAWVSVGVERRSEWAWPEFVTVGIELRSEMAAKTPRKFHVVRGTSGRNTVIGSMLMGHGRLREFLLLHVADALRQRATV